MKNFTLFVFIAVFGLTTFSCKSDDNAVYMDYDTYPVVYDVKNANFSLVDGVYQIARTFNNPMYETDMLLAYMQVGSTNNNSPIWQQIPITFYLDDGNEVDYNYDFSRYDFVIYAGGTFNLGGSSYISNKTFRILLVPASYGKSSNVDYSDYDSVVNFYGIDDSKSRILK